MTWTGARLFDHRQPQPFLMFAGAAIWLVASPRARLIDSFDLRVLLSSGIITAYTWATAFEFWRGRSEPLVSRWPAIFMLFAHGALYLLRTPFGAMLPWLPSSQKVFGSVWLTVLSFEGLMFTISIAFILLAMAKERTEYRHKTAALVDPLTGISNRRAFLQDGEAQLKRQATDPRPMAVMLLDLDNFKSINDRFGHAIGDRVLEIFAEVSSGCLRRIDLFGRLGGEEFAAMLRDTTRERALAVAEADPQRLRRSHPRSRRPAGRGYRKHRDRDQPRRRARSLGVAGAGRSCALPRQGCGRNRVEIASIELILDRARRGAVERLTAVGDRAAGSKTRSLTRNDRRPRCRTCRFVQRTGRRLACGIYAGLCILRPALNPVHLPSRIC